MFILLAEDATPIQPTESPFNLPALRLDDKFTLCYGALHDIDDDAKPALGKFDKPALVALIHEDSVQPWEAPFGFMKNVLGTITICNRCSTNNDKQNEAERVSQEMALAAFHRTD